MIAKRPRCTAQSTVVTLGVSAALLVAGGTAFAYWTVSGSGSGSATARSASGLVVTSQATVSGLYPTGSLSGGSLSVANNNPFAVTISSSFGSAWTTKSGCTGSVVTFSVAAGAPTSIAANSSVSVPFSASMSNAAEDLCQGATFTATLTVNGQSAV